MVFEKEEQRFCSAIAIDVRSSSITPRYTVLTGTFLLRKTHLFTCETSRRRFRSRNRSACHADTFLHFVRIVNDFRMFSDQHQGG